MGCRAGECKVTVVDELGRNNHVATLRRGEYFGEQSLLNNAARNATVVADGEVATTVLELTRFGFENSITAHITALLAQVPLLTSLDPAKRSWLAKGMMLRSFDPGHTLITQGETGDSFYIIEHGECVVRIKGIGEVARLRYVQSRFRPTGLIRPLPLRRFVCHVVGG